MAKRWLNDGNYPIEQLNDALSNDDFKSEKEFCDYIEANIKLFCRDVIGVEYKEHQREFNITGHKDNRRIKNNKRLDFLITTQTGEKIAIECKNPKYISELCAGLGQVLSYIFLFESAGHQISKYVIVSTRIDWILPLTIQRFNLPISFVTMDKNRVLTWLQQKQP
jgi:hypothetical protein